MVGLVAGVVALAFQALLVAAQPLFTCDPTNDPTACTALGALYVATGGASWTSNSGWATAASGTQTDYCTFTGVACLASTNTIISLCAPPVLGARSHRARPSQEVGFLSVPFPRRYLASNNLVGTLPSSLGSLTQLTALSLASNSLSGTVPASVAALALPCQGMNTNVGVGNLLSGCMLNVSGNRNIVQGRNIVVQGNRDYVNGTHEVVTGSRNYVVDSASSDTARLGLPAVQCAMGTYPPSQVIGDQNIVQRNAHRNVVQGNLDVVNNDASNNTIQGSHGFVGSGASNNVLRGCARACAHHACADAPRAAAGRGLRGHSERRKRQPSVGQTRLPARWCAAPRRAPPRR